MFFKKNTKLFFIISFVFIIIININKVEATNYVTWSAGGGSSFGVGFGKNGTTPSLAGPDHYKPGDTVYLGGYGAHSCDAVGISFSGPQGGYEFCSGSCQCGNNQSQGGPALASFVAPSTPGSYSVGLTGCFTKASPQNCSSTKLDYVVDSPPPKGSVDVADCNSLAGWAYDPSSSATSINVDVYKDWPAGQGGTMVGRYLAGDSNRQDVNSAFGITGNHGFSIPLPNALKDGAFHGVYFYAIAASGAGPNPQLSGSPKYINGCKQPVAPSVQIKFGLMDKIKSSLENIFVAMKTAVTPEKVLASIIK